MTLVKMILRITILSVVVAIGLAKPAAVKADVRKYTNVQDQVDAYLQCYRIFTDSAAGPPFKSMCPAWKKLSVCKQKIKAVFPRVEDWVMPGGYAVQEYIANYWCTYIPLKYMPPVEALWYKYNHCPYTDSAFLVLPEDYSASESLAYRRAWFAASLHGLVNKPSLTQWHPQSNYSDPADPVYIALASMYCEYHRYFQYRTHIVDKYCFLWDIYRDLNEKLACYSHQHLDGLYNWDPSLCPLHPQDPVEKMINIVQLETYLRLQVNSSLDQCHASNVDVRVGSCIIMFHTLVPPDTDLHRFMQGFCKPIKKLYRCWDQVAETCPKHSMNSDLDVLIKLYQLACDLSQQNLSTVWDIIYSWSSAVKTVKGSQSVIQLLAGYMFSEYEKPRLSDHSLVLPFASTLNRTLITQPHITPELRSLLKEVAFYLSRINLLLVNRYQGLSSLFGLHNINAEMAQTISGALYPLVEVVLTEGGFIDYDPSKPWPWKN